MGSRCCGLVASFCVSSTGINVQITDVFQTPEDCLASLQPSSKSYIKLNHVSTHWYGTICWALEHVFWHAAGYEECFGCTDTSWGLEPIVHYGYGDDRCSLVFGVESLHAPCMNHLLWCHYGKWGACLFENVHHNDRRISILQLNTNVFVWLTTRSS